MKVLEYPPFKQTKLLRPANMQPARAKRVLKLLLILLGISLGLIVAFFIARNDWFYALALVSIIPITVLTSNYPFGGVIIWLLLNPFVAALPEASIIYWLIYRILTPVIRRICILSRIFKSREQPSVKPGLPELAMGIFIVLGPSLILINQTDYNTPLIRFADRMILPFCMYLVIRFTAAREREIRYLQWVALFIVLSQCIIGLISWSAPQYLPSVWQYLQGERTTGSLKDPDLYAAMLIFGTSLLIQGAIKDKAGLVRYGFFLAGGLGALFVFLSLERAAWLGEILVMVGMVVLFRKPMIRLIFIGLIVVAIFGRGILSTHISLSTERLYDPEPVYDRIVVFDAMLQMSEIKPILGWGYETLNDNIQQFYRRVGEATIPRGLITSHNTYLTILTELGIVGLLLYIFPVVWWFLLSIKVWSRMPVEGLWSRSLLAVFWLIMLFNFVVNNFLDMRWFPIGLTLWWLVLGFIANMVYPYLGSKQVWRQA